VVSQVPDVPQAPRPSQSVTSPAKEDNGANKGFERFLKLLNKKEHAKVSDTAHACFYGLITQF